MKRYKQILLYVVSTMSSIYNWCDRWHVKCVIKILIVSVQNFWYAPCIYYIQSFRHQICNFSRDIILYDFVHSNIGTIFDSTNYSWCYVMITFDTWLSILYLIMGYSTFKLYNSSYKKVVIELKFIIIWNLSQDLWHGIHKIWTWLNAIFYFS